MGNGEVTSLCNTSPCLRALLKVITHVSWAWFLLFYNQLDKNVQCSAVLSPESIWVCHWDGAKGKNLDSESSTLLQNALPYDSYDTKRS